MHALGGTTPASEILVSLSVVLHRTLQGALKQFKKADLRGAFSLLYPFLTSFALIFPFATKHV